MKQLNELQFAIYSNALLKIGQLILDSNIPFHNNNGPRYLHIPIETFHSALYDLVVFDRKLMRFIRVDYKVYTNKKQTKTKTLSIEFPEYLDLNVYL